jgi:hypothetical protein
LAKLLSYDRYRINISLDTYKINIDPKENQ